MTVERYIRIFAGLFILVSLALGVQGSPVFVSPWFLAFTAFVGANLFQFGFTNMCPTGLLPEEAGRAREAGHQAPAEHWERRSHEPRLITGGITRRNSRCWQHTHR